MFKYILFFVILISTNVFGQDISYQQLKQIVANNNRIGFPNGNAVGYQPVITTLPSGVSLSAGVIVSADRRYVRISLSPIFSGIRHVSTFNYVTGKTNEN